MYFLSVISLKIFSLRMASEVDGLWSITNDGLFWADKHLVSEL